MATIFIGSIQIPLVSGLSIQQTKHNSNLLILSLITNCQFDILVAIRDKLLIHSKCNTIGKVSVSNCVSVFGSVGSAYAQNTIYLDGKLYNSEPNTRVYLDKSVKVSYKQALHPEMELIKNNQKIENQANDIMQSLKEMPPIKPSKSSKYTKNSRTLKTVIEIINDDVPLSQLIVNSILNIQTQVVIKGNVNHVECGNCLEVKGLIQNGKADNVIFTKERQGY